MSNLPDSILPKLAERFSGNVNRLTLGFGATVSATYKQTRARFLFLELLDALAPQVANCLITPEALDLGRDQQNLMNAAQEERCACAQELNRASTGTEALALITQQLDAPVQKQLSGINDRLDTHIAAWQRRFHLSDSWMADAARVTLHIAACQDDERPARTPLLPAFEDFIPDLNEGYDVEADGLITLGKLLNDEIFQGSDVPIGIFNPRTQTVDIGVKSLLPELEFRLRTLLSTIVLKDMHSHESITKPVELRKKTKFEWLVRYQVLGNSRSHIARTTDSKRHHIGAEIKDAATLIGMTLREHKGGRPPKRHARTKRVG